MGMSDTNTSERKPCRAGWVSISRIMPELNWLVSRALKSILPGGRAIPWGLCCRGTVGVLHAEELTGERLFGLILNQADIFPVNQSPAPLRQCCQVIFIQPLQLNELLINFHYRHRLRDGESVGQCGQSQKCPDNNDASCIIPDSGHRSHDSSQTDQRADNDLISSQGKVPFTQPDFHSGRLPDTDGDDAINYGVEKQQEIQGRMMPGEIPTEFQALRRAVAFHAPVRQ